MDRYRSYTDSPDFDRFPSPFDSIIHHKIHEIAQKYGVSFPPNPPKPSTSLENTSNLINSIRKKYLSSGFVSVETQDWQVSESESEPATRVDKEMQTDYKGKDSGTQTEEGLEGKSGNLKGKKWDIPQVPVPKAEILERKREGKPPLANETHLKTEKIREKKAINRRKLRNFEEFLYENPELAASKSAKMRSLLDNDPDLQELRSQKASLMTALEEVKETQSELRIR